MTRTINVPQEVVDNLSAGEHTFSVTVESEDGFSTTESQKFVAVGFPTITVDEDFGTKDGGFNFDIILYAINDNATVIGYMDGEPFYRLNYATDGTYNVKVSDNALMALSGGEHKITFSLVDARGKTAESESKFTKTYSLPIVAMATNLGDKSGAFAVTFTIKNAQSEHPSLSAYLDTVTSPIFTTDDASQINSITIDADTFNGLDNGSHTVIVVVTNDAGNTTKNASFNKKDADSSFTGLKLGYTDDTWDGTTLPNRIYEESNVTYAGSTYKSFEDKTPYDTEGEVVTGGLLAAFSRGVQNAGASNFVKNLDGSFTETSANGVSNLTRTDNGYVEVFTDKEGNTLTKNVYFNSDGSVSESTSYERA